MSYQFIDELVSDEPAEIYPRMKQPLNKILIQDSTFESNYATESAIIYAETNHTSLSMKGLTVSYRQE